MKSLLRWALAAWENFCRRGMASGESVTREMTRAAGWAARAGNVGKRAVSTRAVTPPAVAAMSASDAAKTESAWKLDLRAVKAKAHELSASSPARRASRSS